MIIFLIFQIKSNGCFTNLKIADFLHATLYTKAAGCMCVCKGVQPELIILMSSCQKILYDWNWISVAKYISTTAIYAANHIIYASNRFMLCERFTSIIVKYTSVLG